MSFFYDLNKKLDSIRATPEVTHQQLNERDLGKHNNATTGFAALAKKTGGGEKGARIAGAQLAKMRAKGQVEEDFGPGTQGPKRNQAGPGPITPDTENYKTPKSDMVRDYYKKSGTDLAAQDWAAKKGAWDTDAEGQNRYVDRTAPGIMNTLKNKLGYDMPDPAYGPKPDERERLAKRYPAPMEEGSIVDGVWTADPPKKGQPDVPAPSDPDGGILNKKTPPTPTPPASAASRAAPPTKKTANEAAKWRAPEHKGKLYTQKPGDSDDDDYMDLHWNDYGPKMRPKNDPGVKRRTGGVGSEFDRTDPLVKGFGRSGTGSPVEKGPRKGLPKRDQITSLKGSIKDAHGTHTQPNLPEAGVPMTAKQKSFAKLAPPADKITFADKIAGAKKEVDEMLGQVAADAMKKAIGSGRGRNAEMDEGHIDWTDDDRGRRRSSTGGRVDTTTPGVTRHSAGQRYSGAGHDASGDDEPTGAAGRRKVGAGNGKKIGAKINRGTSKLMTREGDQDPADQGEYGREGESSRNNIHTMMRNAKQLEKMLGNEDNLPEWVQEKLTLASDYMQTIADYLASERETDAEDETGMELAEKKSVRSKPKLANRDYDNDGKLETGPEEHAGSVDNAIKKAKKPGFAKKVKEEEVEESTTAGSVVTAPTSGKAGKGGMTFGKGIYDSIDRAVERQINESMNISMNMSTDEHGGPGQSLTITATDEDAVQLAQLLKMAGLGGGEGETCDTCGMADCGCGDMEQMDETYGDNVVDMNSPDYPTNTELGSLKTALTGGGLNKQKGSGMATIPVTDVSLDGEDMFSRAVHETDELSRIKEMAGIFPDPKDVAKQLGIPTTRLIDTPTPMSTSSNRSYNNTFLDPAQKAQQKQNESIFTDTANLWKRYKG